jgi:hypothetical protein
VTSHLERPWRTRQRFRIVNNVQAVRRLAPEHWDNTFVGEDVIKMLMSNEFHQALVHAWYDQDAKFRSEPEKHGRDLRVEKDEHVRALILHDFNPNGVIKNGKEKETVLQKVIQGVAPRFLRSSWINPPTGHSCRHLHGFHWAPEGKRPVGGCDGCSRPSLLVPASCHDCGLRFCPTCATKIKPLRSIARTLAKWLLRSEVVAIVEVD